ncbi:hypothetical protein LCGC14_0209400 [marine sediment metagenome]|uniref:Uncharacterized protein n=1 Tax=marine sediment metagenome TaxID=412755 RepID=A0A0F9ULE9_9ZZZZ
MSKTSKIAVLDERNAEVLVELICGPNISETLRIQAMSKLTESNKDDTFFTTMFKEKLDWGKCPHCSHENFWLTPEDQSNQMGWVSHKEDKRVPENTDAKSCPLYEQACKKKRIVT